MDCARVIRDEIAEQYVAGRLNEDDASAFEGHYFACPRCFEDVQAWRTMRAALERSGHASRRMSVIRGRSWLWPAAAAATVLISLAIFYSRYQDSQPQRAASPAASPQPPSPEILSARLAELSAVGPVPYQPARRRGVSDEAMRRFEQAMTQYQAKDYPSAARGLEDAARLDASVPAIQFYLGICYLLTGDADRAIDRLNATIALGQTAYLEEAEFHLGKAFLRKGDLPAAREAMTRTIALKGDREADAKALLAALATLESPAGGSRP